MGQRLSILLVDDDVLLCRGLARSLRQEQFDVHVVHCAADALAHCLLSSIDIILLDWILPDRDGVAILQVIRERGMNVPVIMLTGENSIEGRVHALNRGADDYIAKPFAVEELIARVHALIRRRSGSFTVSRVGQISVDTWKQEVTVNDSRIDLTSHEYALLTCLIRKAEEVVSRKELLEAIWNEKGADVTSKALDSQLVRLRRKLGSAAEQLETVRGAGFRLNGKQRAVG